MHKNKTRNLRIFIESAAGPAIKHPLFLSVQTIIFDIWKCRIACATY